MIGWKCVLTFSFLTKSYIFISTETQLLILTNNNKKLHITKKIKSLEFLDEDKPNYHRLL